MKNLITEIKSQAKIASVLELTTPDRNKIIEEVRDFTNLFINELPEVASFNQEKTNKEKIALQVDRPKTMGEILSIFKEEVNDKGLRAASGGHVGYIPGGGIYMGAIGDFLAAVSNEYAGVSYASPGATAIENATIDWLKSIFNFPRNAVGNLTSGGSIANLIALTAARDKYGVKNEKIKKSVIYISEQAHHSIKKALRIIGLEDVILRFVPLDATFKMVPEKLEESIRQDIQNGNHPFLIIAAAGTTNVGAIDPLEELANLSAKYNLWLHIDAAYGGFFILSSKKALFKGIERADSIIVDPHKGMFLPYGLGAVLIRDAKAALHSNTTSGDYLQDAIIEDLTQDPSNLSPELTKHFRGMRLWVPLQLHGIKPFVACLEEKLLLTRYFRQKLVEMGFKIGPEPDLSVSYFYYPFAENQNEKNKQLMQEIHKDGSVFLSSTLVNERFVIRMAILSFRTSIATIDKALTMIERALQRIN